MQIYLKTRRQEDGRYKIEFQERKVAVLTTVRDLGYRQQLKEIAMNTSSLLLKDYMKLILAE
jgi:hypothetical protein